MMDKYDVITKVLNSNKVISDLRTTTMMFKVQGVTKVYFSLSI
jgi:hypothetical protein